jgi:phosphoglycolate phosphatase-like HAD superfamily hydrolase
MVYLFRVPYLAAVKTFVLFDIDGTLLYSEKTDSRSFATSYEAIFGLVFPTIDWTKFAEVTDHVIFRTAFYDHFDRYPTEDERVTFEDHYLCDLAASREKRPEEFREVPGSAELWRRLEADDRFVPGIATGGWQRPAAIKLAHVGIPSAHPYAGYANGKFSRVDILNEAIELAGAVHEIDRVIYVGDAVWDVTTTQKMGLPLIGVRRKGDHDELRRFGADRIVTDFNPPQAFFNHLEELLA